MGEIFMLLKTEKAYRRLLLASLLSGIGDWFNSVALLSLLLRLTGSGLAVGVLLAVRTLPYLVMGPVGGLLADRMNRKTILLISDFARAVMALSFLLIHSVHGVWIAYTGTLALIVFSALLSPARTAVIPQLVSSDRVVQANSVEQSTFGFVMALGSALAGVVTAAFGTNAAFVINSMSFLVSGLICLSIRFPTDHLAVHSHRHTSTPQVAVPSLWTVFRRSRLVQIITLQALLWAVGGGGINVLLSVYGFHVFHRGNVGVGVLYGALGLGFLISGFITHRFTSWMRQAAVLGILVEGICHVLVSQSSNLWWASICLVVATIGAGICNASVTSLIMHNVQKEVHGRVFALFDTISNVTIACSMMLAGVLLNEISARTLGLGSGLLLVIASIVSGVPLVRTKLPSYIPELLAGRGHKEEATL